MVDSVNVPHATLKHITGWLRTLGGVCTPPPSRPLDKEALATNATLLGMDYPTGAFTTASLKLVAEGEKWFPEYETIRQKVGAWWMENRPIVAKQISDGRYEGLSIEDQHWLRWWDAAQARNFGPAKEGGPKSNPGVMESMLRRYAPKVHDLLAPSADPEHPPNRIKWAAQQWDDDEFIFNRMHQHANHRLALALLRFAVKANAPQHMEMLPDAEMIQNMQGETGLRRMVRHPDD